MKKLSKKQWYSVIRHSLTAIGGVLITLGLVNETIVMEVSGSIIAILGIIWGIKDKA
jgi:hypothetical protein